MGLLVVVLQQKVAGRDWSSAKARLVEGWPCELIGSLLLIPRVVLSMPVKKIYQ